LNPYANFHGSYFFSVPFIDHRSSSKKSYPYQEVITPYERLSNVHGVIRYLYPGITFEKLGTIIKQIGDNQFAEGMVNARSKFF